MYDNQYSSSLETLEYPAKIKELEQRFNIIERRWIRYADNVKPNDLAQQASRTELFERRTSLGTLMIPSIQELHDEGTTATTDISSGATEVDNVAADKIMI